MEVFAHGLRGLCLGLLLTAAAGVATAQSLPPGSCPQPRFTGKAPDEYYGRANPVAVTPQALSAGEATYAGDPRRVNCATCHGKEGRGDGKLADQFDPRPRNFACADTIKGVPDGQLFWIIRYGSPGTSMPPHKRLSDEEIWQVVHYIRALAK